jgi:hypothetical protein
MSPMLGGLPRTYRGLPPHQGSSQLHTSVSPGVRAPFQPSQTSVPTGHGVQPQVRQFGIDPRGPPEGSYSRSPYPYQDWGGPPPTPVGS